LSGNIAESDTEEGCTIAEGTGGWIYEETEDVVELVRGRFEVLTVGAIPVVGNVRLEVPALVPGPRLPALEKLTLEPALSLPLCSGLLVPGPCASSPLVPSSNLALRSVLSE
jgi:hypothetical protein